MQQLNCGFQLVQSYVQGQMTVDEKIDFCDHVDLGRGCRRCFERLRVIRRQEFRSIAGTSGRKRKRPGDPPASIRIPEKPKKLADDEASSRRREVKAIRERLQLLQREAAEIHGPPLTATRVARIENGYLPCPDGYLEMLRFLRSKFEKGAA